MAVIGTSSVGEVYRNGKTVATRFRVDCVNYAARMASSEIEASRIIELYARTGNIRVQFLEVAATPGLDAVAQDLEGDIGYSPAAEYTALAALCLDVLTWIETNVPQDGDGYTLTSTLSGGTVTYRMVTSAQTAGLRTALQAIVDHISVS